MKQRISIPWLWQFHNLPGTPKPGGRCRSPFYQDNNPDFFISGAGSWFKDWGERDQKGDVLDFEMLASRCTPGEAIRRLRQLANLPEDATRRLPVNTRAQPREINTAGPLEPMPLDFLERGITGDLKRLAKLRCLAPETVQMAQGDGYSLASSVCKPRGGPKISRRRIASRKPEFDTSKEAISVLKSARLAIPKAFWAA